MLEGFIGGLITAWFLSLFSINNMLIEVVQPVFDGITLTNSHYYILFGLIGLVGGMIAKS